MATLVRDERLESTPLSLYFAVSHNEMPQLDVIARASVAWCEMIREIASVVDPSLDIRIDFVSGTIGSRSINTILRAVTKVAGEHPWTAGSLGAVAGVFLLAPANHVATDLTNHLAKKWFDHEDSVLSDADVDRVARKVSELQRDKLAVAHKTTIFAEADREPLIKGVGTGPVIATTPAIVIPREQFRLHGGQSVISDEEIIEQRTRWEYDYPVVIIRSYSKAEERRWRFEHGPREFSATMRDPEFLAAIRAGHTGIEIGEGIQMRVDLRIKEEKVGDFWIEKEIDVMRVVSPSIGKRDLFDLPPN